jgi:hypothetical protein
MQLTTHAASATLRSQRCRVVESSCVAAGLSANNAIAQNLNLRLIRTDRIGRTDNTCPNVGEFTTVSMAE